MPKKINMATPENVVHNSKLLSSCHNCIKCWWIFIFCHWQRICSKV